MPQRIIPRVQNIEYTDQCKKCTRKIASKQSNGYCFKCYTKEKETLNKK